ncbi:hypothetical protein [Chroococcidiopsis sp.]|uniref:hypothetical protein n=1 Tax=Chroococcidiopsis sp. TaxID=3088168 RepID=UPI003F32DE13
MTVGQTIYEQLRATAKTEMFCWGAREYVDMGDGLKFKVNGAKFKGYVYVKYDGILDTYTVQLATIKKLEWKVKQEVSDVYCDELGSVIDSLVEQ